AAVIVRGLFGHILILIKYHTFLISWNHVSYRQAMEWAMQMHPTTFGVYTGMAITFLLEFGFQSPQKKIYWFSYSLLTVMLILLFPKMPVFALFFVHLMFGFRQRKQLKRLRVVIPVLGVVAALCFLLNLHLVKDRINELLPGSSIVSAPNSVQVRQLIWQTDLALLKYHWLKGMGPGELQRNLDLSMLYQSSLAGQSLGSYNTHNEYLNYWLVFGIPGIVVLVGLIIFLAFKAFQSSRLSFQAFVILVSGVFLTENWLSVQHGVVFIAILGTLFLCSPAMLNSGKEH
ncbi:MAG: O-antigen ligase family protein, partial [Chitinophagaceae bacterium]|nr:O-antigen ligase family protein [Chitinophagaceae bacterium]